MTDPVVKRIPPNFYDLVKKWYGFLESQYGFRSRFETSARPGHAADGMVDENRFHGGRDRQRPGRRFRLVLRIRDGKQFYLTPAASALSKRTSLLNQPAWRSQGRKTFEELEKCLENYAGWLREHAGLCLSGDFSRWLAFYEYKLERARAESLRRGEDELVRALLKDAEGNWQMVKRPRFADEREHIEKLKKESAA